VAPFAEGQLLIVADGAGGTSGGDRAAEEVIAQVRRLDPASTWDWVEVLRRIDRTIHDHGSGETTAVIVFVTDREVRGASVGDSGAWMLAGSWLDLLEARRRKPLLGTGNAVPVGFGPFPMGERLLLGTDGLFKYVNAEHIDLIASRASLEKAAADLIDAARLPSGALQDDIAVILAEQVECSLRWMSISR
jgi:serine/threonine protein phosphatase PrpC